MLECNVCFQRRRNQTFQIALVAWIEHLSDSLMPLSDDDDACVSSESHWAKISNHIGRMKRACLWLPNVTSWLVITIMQFKNHHDNEADMLVGPKNGIFCSSFTNWQKWFWALKIWPPVKTKWRRWITDNIFVQIVSKSRRFRGDFVGSCRKSPQYWGS